MMIRLPDESIENNILLRLPVKSLLRFRRVSKHWCALIDTKDFVNQHLNKTNEHASLVFNNSRKLYSVRLNLLGAQIPTPLELDHPVNNPHYSQYSTVIVGACNGLVCLKYISRIIIWNPATRKHVKVPRVVHTHISPSIRRMYEIKYDNIMYGFGYDNSVSDDYKVVIMTALVSRYSSRSKFTYTYVYSLKSNSWSKTKNVQLKFNFYKDYPGALLCGSIHWLVAKTKLDLESVSLSIAAFDLVTEKYTMVSLPDCSPHDELKSIYVLELAGCLSFSYRHSNTNNGGVIHVWVMKEYGVRDSWTILLSISCSDHISRFAHSYRLAYSYPLAYSESGQEVLLRNNAELLWYNLEKGTVTTLDCRNLATYHHVIYSESLVTLGENAENDEN